MEKNSTEITGKEYCAMITWSIARQWLGKHNSAAMNMHIMAEELFGVVFSMWSVPRLYSEHEQEKFADSS
jgi:hypothetical protein